MKLRRLAINEEGFIFDPETGNSYTVNETGLFILEKLRQGLSPEEIARLLSQEYDISPEEARRDLEDFLEVLVRYGLWKEPK
ncbi:MAG TPA: HPr-rel-A system PqqD family peptide chaperone [Thermosulfurimonas dismutans]|uniref:HPr-rel-A system PqqD family peptide chaperone n=1 Tax=Thermosulfurimonas dismutans TaxID=999894 RepID=A0A7C3GSP5_9BACT|nr:HPr-rel-A system PqqD family peptide chaperone [Thermosulfurimonas dismutans]